MMKTRYTAQQGLSIVELMVALALSAVLTLGLVQIFIGNSQTFRMNEASARVQETGRTAQSILARAVRNADYWGCSRPGGDAGQVHNMLRAQDDFDPDSMMVGLAGIYSIGADNNYGAVPGTDLVSFGGVQSNAALTATAHTPFNSATIFTGVNPTDLVEEGEIVLLSDCRAADMFQVTQVQSNQLVANTGGSTYPGNATQTQSDYDPGARILRPSQAHYFVTEDENGNRSLAFNPMQTQSANGATAGDLVGAEELVDGVWDLRILYGIDADGNGRVGSGSNSPAPSAGSSHWKADPSDSEMDSVIALHYSILVRSPQENVVNEPQTFCFPGWLDCESDASLLTTADDRNLYRVYTMTSSIRNRMRR